MSNENGKKDDLPSPSKSLQYFDKPRTLLDKLWDSHVVDKGDAERPSIVAIDLHLIHEVTSHQAFALLESRNLQVRSPHKTIAVHDHATPTGPREKGSLWHFHDESVSHQVFQLTKNCQRHGIKLLDLESDLRGIVHVIGPELGLSRPGMTIVCGDSHTSTHGAFGALAFGIGSTEVGHVLATQCILQHKPQSMRVEIWGELESGLSAKDIALGVIAHIGEQGGRGAAIEFCGDVVAGLSMEGRMTLCNMAIEAGARTGLVAPDSKTVGYVLSAGDPLGFHDEITAEIIEGWLSLASDPGAQYDKEVRISVNQLGPRVTFGTRPGMNIAVSESIPYFIEGSDEALALSHMGLRSGTRLTEVKVDVVFVGSCTNGRIEDLRVASHILRGKRIADHVQLLIVPGSESVKRQAEAEGLAEIFIAAGGEWRAPGCSLCVAMNGDILRPGQLAVSTSNRNFAGRQGPGSRTLLASPATAAASALCGRVADFRLL